MTRMKIIVLLCVLTGLTGLPSGGAHTPGAGPNPAAHMPAEYRNVTIPEDIWTDRALIVRGRVLYDDKCAVCHGPDGAGDGPAAAGLPIRPASFRDRAMVAEMSARYFFWRITEGGQAEPFRSLGSVMPAWKSELGVDDRHALMAFLHTQSGHEGPHTPREHPQMLPDGPMPHPPIRGVNFSGWVTRDHRWPPRGAWNWAVPRLLPELFREFNGIDFGHSHLGETLLLTQDPARVERARLEVLAFIFGSPRVAPDEEQVAPTFSRLSWELQKAFGWAHTFHRSLYDLFASDAVTDKDAAYRRLLADYLDKSEAITTHPLDHHKRLWMFEESRSFAQKFPKFNTQIWAYHWLQAATYDVQLGRPAREQRTLLVERIMPYYHGLLRQPPVEWQFMPMMSEGAPEFSRRFREAAAIFDNLHMLHDNVDDVLVRPDLFPTRAAQREAILKLLSIYLHRNHGTDDRYAEFHAEDAMHEMPGPRPPTAAEVLAGRVSPRKEHSQ